MTALPLEAAIAAAAMTGLLVGSFANVVIYRVPRGLSVARPRSFCPACRRQLVWWENVPVVSWLALGGRCRTGHEPISIRYPLVEGGMGLAFALTAWAQHGSVMTIPYCLLAATLITILLIDIGDLQAPLVVAAIGTAIADAVLVAASVPAGHWSVVIGAQVGTLVGTVGFSALRRLDPECRWRWGCGRSALIPAGCWLGGLGITSTVAGTETAVVVFLLAATLDRYTGVHHDRAPTSPTSRSIIPLVVTRPLLAAVSIGAGVGLVIFR